MRSYRVMPWDQGTWMVVKTDGRAVEGYMVELNVKTKWRHWCGCRWFECHEFKKSERVPPCKHIVLVEKEIIKLAQTLCHAKP